VGQDAGKLEIGRRVDGAGQADRRRVVGVDPGPVVPAVHLEHDLEAQGVRSGEGLELGHRAEVVDEHTEVVGAPHELGTLVEAVERTGTTRDVAEPGCREGARLEVKRTAVLLRSGTGSLRTAVSRADAATPKQQTC
jgi:hypothetical protein